MIERILFGDPATKEGWQAFTNNYPILRDYVLQRSFHKELASTESHEHPGYPTPQEVAELLRDPLVRQAYTTRVYDMFDDFYGGNLLRNLPIYSPEEQQEGYEQFLEIVERKRIEQGTLGKKIRTHIPYGPLTKEMTTIVGSKLFQEREHPFIEVGGPTFRWGFRHAPQPFVRVNKYPFRQTEFMMDAEHMPFPDESIGAVFDSYVPAEMGDEVERVLEPGGIWVSGGDGIDVFQKNASKLKRIKTIW